MNLVLRMILISSIVISTTAIGSISESPTSTTAQTWSRTQLLNRIEIFKSFTKMHCLKSSNWSSTTLQQGQSMIQHLSMIINNIHIPYDLRVTHAIRLGMTCRQCEQIGTQCRQAMTAISPDQSQKGYSRFSDQTRLFAYVGNIYQPTAAGESVPSTPSSTAVSVAATNSNISTVATRLNEGLPLKKQTPLSLFMWAVTALLIALCISAGGVRGLLRKIAQKTAPVRALIVDDDPLSLVPLKAMLKQLQVQVESVESPSDARRALLSKNFNFVFLDYTMPEISGDQLLLLMNDDIKTKVKNYRNKLNHFKSKVIFYTGTPRSIVPEKLVADQFEFVGIISKQLSNTALRHAVRKIAVGV